MEDINLNAENFEEEVVKCFEKYLNEPMPVGVGIFPDTVIDKVIDILCKYWIS